jgi:ComF family protein
VFRHLLSLVAPPFCGVCGDPCGATHDVCPACQEAILAAPPSPFAVPGIDHAWAAARYDGVPRRLVAALKFGRRIALARIAAEAIAAAAPGELGGAIVPVPADPLRRRLRGFDPADLIAGELARATELPLSRCLVRRHARRQVGRSRAERLASPPRVGLRGEAPPRAVLLDDVATTGATLAECAMALRTGGCSDLLALTFARA